MVIYYVFLDYYFCFVVPICDLVHDLETIFHFSYVLTASGNRYTGSTHISEKISRCC